ncbi:MAG: hypothetical protein PHP62_02910 [Candidatus Moranbacteria bacterium]|nr:hypothetical protein [Candidatus Moranbacteria bacterium]
MIAIFSLVLFLVAFLTAFALLRERNELLLFRATALVFAIAVIGMFNLNWLFDFSIEGWRWIALFAIIFLLTIFFRKENIFEKAKLVYQENKTAYTFSIAIIFIAFLFASSYFHWDLNVPRYSTPDSGTHFLYMNETAKNGRMAVFGKNLIEEASGDATIAPKHNETYFPGATAAFAFLETIIQPKNPAMTLQIFNALCYAILAGYFIFLFFTRKIIKEKIVLVVLSAIILLGSFFNFVATSHSTQLLGLLFLVAFVDTYESYLQKKESFFVPALFFGAMISTYFYWLPIALAFVAIRILFLDLKIKNFVKEFLQAMFPLAAGSVFCAVYVLIMFKFNMFQYSSSDGGVAFQGQLLSDALLIAPFAVWQLFSLLRDWKENSDNKKFVAAFFAGVVVFALMLAVLYKNGVLISHYTAMKVLYLVVPAAWVLALMFFEENYATFKMFFKKIIKKDWIAFGIFKKQLTIFAMLFLLTVGTAKFFEVGLNLLPLMEKNIKIIINNEKEPELSADQMRLLDETKAKHGDVLQDGKIFIMGPNKNVWWAFAYSGIWPRTDSLVTEHPGNYSELNFSYSSVDDYANWLKRDTKHILIYFNADTAAQCTDCNMFNIADYKKLETRGDNYLLELKKDAKPVYEYQKDVKTEKSDRITLPLNFSFSSTDYFLAGISLRLQVNPKKDVQNDLLLEIFKGDCLEKSTEKISLVVVKKEDIIKKGEKRTVKVYFDKTFQNASDAKWCARLSTADEKTSKAVGIGKYPDGSFDVRPIYAY